MSTFVKNAPDSLIVETAEVPWLPFEYSEGGLKWKLLYTQANDPRWTVMFRGPKGSYIYPHLHTSEAEGLLLYGQVGRQSPGVQGAEPEDRTVWVRELGEGGRHQRTTMMMDDTCFFLTIFGPIRWIHEHEDGSETYTDLTAQEIQTIWDRQYAEYAADRGEPAVNQ